MLRSSLRQIRRIVRDAWRGETRDTYFDIGNRDELNELLVDCGVPGTTLDPQVADENRLGALRWLIGLLQRYPRLRRRFPTAFSDGSASELFTWLLAEGGPRFHLSAKALEHLRALFAADLSQRIRRVYELRQDLRLAYPFGVTPKQRGQYARWLLTFGKADFDLRPEEILWWLFEADEDPSRGLTTTYLLNPQWQTDCPLALTIFGWQHFLDYLRTRHRLASRWVRSAKLPQHYSASDQVRLLAQSSAARQQSFPRSAWEAGDFSAICRWLTAQRDLPRPSTTFLRQLHHELASGHAQQPGVNVIGHYRYASGLQEAVFGTVRALQRVGYRTSQRDIPVNFPCDWRDRERYQGVELFDVSIVNAAANTFLEENLPFAGLRIRPDVYRIAIWYWELEQVPSEWVQHAELVDEIWAPTTFIAEAMRQAMPKPVYAMLPGVELPPVRMVKKSHFGLRDDAFLFLFLFDMGSVMARKNPLGLIEAFRRAFSPKQDVQLAIKVSRGDSNRANKARLLEAAHRAGVTVIDKVLPREDSLSLLAVADAYVSLHRSEGLGLTLIESMLLGTPTIATAYSGNIDFMTTKNSYLVEYRRTRIVEDIPPYPRGAFWAEPSLDHAAELMRYVVDHPEETQLVAQRAKRELTELFSIEAAGRRMAERLAELRPQLRLP